MLAPAATRGAGGRADVRFATVQRLAQPQRRRPARRRPLDAGQRRRRRTRRRRSSASGPDVAADQRVRLRRGGTALRLFQDNYLSIAQNGAAPIVYPYRFTAESNTGIPSGFDLNNNGVVGGPDDAYGFGFFPGQFGMAVYSTLPDRPDRGSAPSRSSSGRTCRGARLPDDPATPAPADWYSPAELNVFRLSSKSHWDLPDPDRRQGRPLPRRAIRRRPSSTGPRTGTGRGTTTRSASGPTTSRPAQSATSTTTTAARGGLEARLARS